jgi:ADP-ribose pyrophosphatase YjhB (NUDIX family)
VRKAGNVVRVPLTDSQEPDALRQVQRAAAYCVVTDPAGAVLLVRASNRSDLRGRWFLPGGGLNHGEHPRDGALRELAEETGLRATEATPREATADVIELPHRGLSVHTLRLIYDVELPQTAATDSLRPEPDGTSDLARFVSRDEAATLPLMPFVAQILGLPAPAPLKPEPPDRPESLGELIEPTIERGPDDPVPFQRPAAYAVLIDQTPPSGQTPSGQPPSGDTAGPRMLLTRLAGSTGTWTLPGGGIDHGEEPLAALTRELYEETGLPYTVGPLLDIGSRHFVGRSPNGRLEDFHGLRLVYAGSVPVDRPPQVIEVDGSTDLAAWIPVADLNRIGAVSAVRESFAIWSQRQG